jgi:probable F420-dependent oxidoreductase
MLKFDTNLSIGAISEISAGAQAIEALGFDGLATAETAHDPYLPLVLAAEHTEQLELMTSIAVAFPRSPMITAYTAWDLARYSDGRFLLGLGTQVKGHNERRFSVPWESPGPKLRDLILAIRAIWTAWQERTPLDYHGRFYDFSLMTPFFDPGPIEHPDVPIYIAGVNPYICRLAGELCDGFHVHPLHSPKYVNEVIKPAVAEGAAAAGRRGQDVVLASSCFVVTGDSDEQMAQAAQAVKQQISFYASTRTYAPVLAAHGWEDIVPQLNEHSRKGQWPEMADLISDEMLAEFAVIGRRNEVGDLLREKYTGVLDRIGIYMPFRPGSDDDWWRDVIAAVKR